MGVLSINPGTGHLDGANVENAITNIHKFIEDCKLEGLKVRETCPLDNGDGRFTFELIRDGYPDWSCEVEMPGLPLEQVRYMQEEGQNIWHFPRLYVDGSSWVWCFALLTVEDFKKDKD